MISESTDYHETSIFNEAFLKLRRLHAISIDCYNCSRVGDHNGWFRALNGRFREIVAWLNTEERKKCVKLQQDVREFLMNRASRAKINVLDLEQCLEDYDIYLRDMEHKYDLDMPSAEDPRTAIKR